MNDLFSVSLTYNPSDPSVSLQWSQEYDVVGIEIFGQKFCTMPYQEFMDRIERLRDLRERVQMANTLFGEERAGE